VVAVKKVSRKNHHKKEVPTSYPISPNEMGFFYAIAGKAVRRKEK